MCILKYVGKIKPGWKSCAWTEGIGTLGGRGLRCPSFHTFRWAPNQAGFFWYCADSEKQSSCMHRERGGTEGRTWVVPPLLFTAGTPGSHLLPELRSQSWKSNQHNSEWVKPAGLDCRASDCLSQTLTKTDEGVKQWITQHEWKTMLSSVSVW